MKGRIGRILIFRAKTSSSFFPFSAIDENGVHDFDSSVLETIIKFYLQEPTVSSDNIDNKVSELPP